MRESSVLSHRSVSCLPEFQTRPGHSEPPTAVRYPDPVFPKAKKTSPELPVITDHGEKKGTRLTASELRQGS
ncbi:MAG: hypothetical protein VX399_04950 [SAR324 cluster bacterium]|nr:hypothetical protein [SAR324 cluster bacterium]